jgi:Ca2+-binding RTX toxin-like protein
VSASRSPQSAPEPGGSSEIEIEVHMFGTNLDFIQIRGSGGDDSFRLGQTAGTNGVNLNAGSESGSASDVDLTYEGLEGTDVLAIVAGAGNDRIDGRGGAEFGGPVTTNASLVGNEGDDVVAGGVGPDVLQDGPGDDVVLGGGGADILEPAESAGDDVFDGGTGTDILTSGSASTRVDLRMTGRQDTGSFGRDSLAGIENVATEEGDDVLLGDDASNRLSTDEGDDVVMGGGGALDVLGGGPGTDTLSYASARDGVTVDLGVVAPATQSTGGAGNDQISSFENLIGGPFPDELAGTDAPNAITGLGGGDTIFARGGNDMVQIRDGVGDGASCGAGADTVTADVPGTDAISGDCELVQLDSRPDTQIVSGPAALGNDATPSFAFRTTKAGATLECALDAKAFAPCRSPHTFATVADGAHAFRVRSRDRLGALDLTPALRAFTIDATRPRITRARLAGPVLRYRLSEDATVKIKLRRRTLTRHAQRGANRARLPKRRAGRVLLTARDRAGNRSATKRAR